MSNKIIAEIECMPTPHKDDIINKCIEAIKRSGLKYEVHAMGTVIEGSVRKTLPKISRAQARRTRFGRSFARCTNRP